MATVWISTGEFAPERHDAVRRVLSDSEHSLRDVSEGLDGLLHFYTGVDPEQGYVTNVSDSLRTTLEQRPRASRRGPTRADHQSRDVGPSCPFCSRYGAPLAAGSGPRESDRLHENKAADSRQWVACHERASIPTTNATFHFQTSLPRRQP